MMMSSQNAVCQPCQYKGPANLNEAGQASCRRQAVGQQSTGQVSCRAEGHTSRDQAVGTRQEATSEAKDHLITEEQKSIKLMLGTEAISFVSTAPLLEEEPDVQHPIPCTIAQLVPPHLVPLQYLNLPHCHANVVRYDDFSSDLRL